MRKWHQFRKDVFEGRTLVLCYHRVADLPRDLFDCCVSPGNFAEQVEVLRRMNVVPAFEQLSDVYRPRCWPRNRTVVITFDDGYADSFLTAAPLLERHGLHAIFYIFTGWIEEMQEAWWDRLENIVFSAEDLPATLRLPGMAREFSTVDRASLYKTLNLHLRDASVSHEREKLLGALAGNRPGNEVRPDYRPLTLEELKQFAARPGVHIGAHTVNHAFLPALPVHEQQTEIALSREWLERELGRPVRDFSYPHGGATHETRRAAAAAGMLTAVTTEARPTSRLDDPFAIPRVQVHNWDGAEFARRIEWWFRQ